MKKMLVVLASTIVLPICVNAQTCPATSKTTGAPFLRVAVSPALFSCVYQDGSNFQTNYTSGLIN